MLGGGNWQLKHYPKEQEILINKYLKLKKLMGRRGAPELKLLASPRVCSIVQIVGDAALLVA